MGDDKFKSYTRVLDRIAMALITAIITYGVDQLRITSSNIEKLSTSVSILLVRFDTQSRLLDDLEDRVQFLERSQLNKGK